MIILMAFAELFLFCFVCWCVRANMHVASVCKAELSGLCGLHQSAQITVTSDQAALG